MSTKNKQATAPSVTLGPQAAPSPGALRPPSDLDLMLYADGELEGEALAAVEAWLAKDRTAQQKMLALGMTSAIVREEAIGKAEKADGIADLVMGAITMGPQAAPNPGPAEPAQSAAEEKAAPKSDVAEKPKKQAAAARPANDNARAFRVIAVIAAAAAAALLLWSRGPAEHAGTEPTASLSPRNTTMKADTPHPEGEAARGVEVSAVDFGGRTGAVFYVPTGSAASETTAVVWLSDESAGGNE